MHTKSESYYTIALKHDADCRIGKYRTLYEAIEDNKLIEKRQLQNGFGQKYIILHCTSIQVYTDDNEFISETTTAAVVATDKLHCELEASSGEEK